MRYRYFVSYIFGQGAGIGNAVIILDTKLRDSADISSLQIELCMRTGNLDIIIMNFIFMNRVWPWT